MVESDPDYTPSESEDFSDNLQRTLKENKTNKKNISSYEQRCDIVNDIIDKGDTHSIPEKYGISLSKIIKYNTLINQWSAALSEKDQKKIMDIVEEGTLDHEKLGEVSTFRGKFLNLDALIDYILTKDKSVLRSHKIEEQEFTKYVLYAQVWEVLAKERILLNLQNNGHENISKIIDAIIHQKSKEAISKELKICQSLYDNYKTYVNLWNNLPKNKRKVIANIVQKRSPRKSNLGTIESQSGIKFDVNVIVDLISTKTSRSQFLREHNIERLYHKYIDCANVWEELARRGWEPPKENPDYIKTRDIILTIIDSNYRNADGKKVSVTKATRDSYISPINLWKSLPKNKRKQIIETVQDVENIYDLGSIKTSARTELDINVIVKMIKAKKGKKTAVLESININKQLHRTYQRYAKAWEVLAKERVFL